MKKYSKVIVAVGLGLATLIPVAASKANLLGYHSLCTFAPISTLMCWAMAAFHLKVIADKSRASRGALSPAAAEKN